MPAVTQSAIELASPAPDDRPHVRAHGRTDGMPLYQALLIAATIVSGGLFYDEFGAWWKDALALGQPEWVVGFVLGVVTLLAGIVLVASSSIPQVRVDSKTPGLV